MTKIKILFIGEIHSSHSRAWVSLLNTDEFDIRCFHIGNADLPEAHPHLTYCAKWAFGIKRSVFKFPTFSFMTKLGRRSLLPARLVEKWNERWLAKIVRGWKPDIIHTLGFEASAYFYQRVRSNYALGQIGRWVAQARGGPDLDLYRHLPEKLKKIRAVFDECDHFICDNEQNYTFAFANGLDRSKAEFPGVGVVSGPGGLDVDELRSRWSKLPSQRHRRIVWPKTYEVISSKGLPVLEALIIAWDRIQPCEVDCLWMVQDELRIYFDKMLPEHVKAACNIYGHLTQKDTLDLVAAARVMLAPSLTDGVPNVMMEAMALGAFPIISPLETTLPVVEDRKNVLFARNLYPEEIAEALVQAMNDDVLVDNAAKVNVERVRELADRKKIRTRVIKFYREVKNLSRGEN